MTEKIVDKIKNLLKLSEGNENPNEAAAAAAAANKLMIRYNISKNIAESIGGFSNLNKRDKFTFRTLDVDDIWEASLAEEIAENSQTFILGVLGNNNQIASIKIFGKQEDIEAFVAFFLFLRSEIVRILKQKYLAVANKSDKWQKTFCFSASAAIGERLKKEREKSIAEISETLQLTIKEKGLSIVHLSNAIQKIEEARREIEEFVEEQSKMSEYTPDDECVIRDAALKGHEEGSRMNLRRELKKEKNNEI